MEIYDEGRFFTVTGNVIKDKDRSHIKPIEQELLPLYQQYMPAMGNQIEHKQASNEQAKRSTKENHLYKDTGNHLMMYWNYFLKKDIFIILERI